MLKKTITFALTEAQYKMIISWRINPSEARASIIRRALKAFAESRGEEWPSSERVNTWKLLKEENRRLKAMLDEMGVENVWDD